MRLRTTGLMICLWGLLVTTVYADEPVRLQYKFSPNKPLVYHQVIEKHRTDKARYVTKTTELDEVEEKLFLLRPTKEIVNNRQRIQLELIEKPARQVIKKLKTSSTIEQVGFVKEDEEFFVSQIGEVKVDEATTAKMQKKEPQPGFLFNEESKQDLLRVILRQLPEKPVVKGDSWTVSDKYSETQTIPVKIPDQPVREAKNESETRYKIVCTSAGPVEHAGRTMIKVDFRSKSTGKMTISQGMGTGLFIPMIVANFDSECDSGHFLFDPEAGELVALKVAEKQTVYITGLGQLVELSMLIGFENSPDQVTTVESETTLELLR
ncbi:MAG: hypothetical protein KDA65_04490 [Planctomycetaceae bacterium]|nr:hypothetical protein [Planctomycetaceae bacterium]